MSRPRTILLLAVVGAGVAWYVRSRREPAPSTSRPEPPRTFTAAAPAPTSAPVTAAPGATRSLSDDTAAFAAPVLEPGPYPGSAPPLQDGGSPAPSYVIKGNEDSMLYHEPDGRYFEATEATVWFETSEDAEAAGFARPGSE